MVGSYGSTLRVLGFAAVLMGLSGGCGTERDLDYCVYYQYRYVGDLDISQASLLARYTAPEDRRFGAGWTAPEFVDQVLSGAVIEYSCHSTYEPVGDRPGYTAFAWLDLDRDEEAACLEDYFSPECEPDPGDPQGGMTFTLLGSGQDTHLTIVIDDP
ncbi:MAG: hypothetical protein P1V51_15295 [Deltaproteobacteria bacterium]|nr:hypothetical protein [Deltaproteobacteria bacterium]